MAVIVLTFYVFNKRVHLLVKRILIAKIFEVTLRQIEGLFAVVRCANHADNTRQSSFFYKDFQDRPKHRLSLFNATRNNAVLLERWQILVLKDSKDVG